VPQAPRVTLFTGSRHQEAPTSGPDGRTDSHPVTGAGTSRHDHFFLDYCHLTWEGIDCRAREIGRVVLEETCTGKQIHDPDLDALAVPTRPDAKSEAMAASVAAITNYHFGQSFGNLRLLAAKGAGTMAAGSPVAGVLVGHSLLVLA
jgi:hypothetical protein